MWILNIAYATRLSVTDSGKNYPPNGFISCFSDCCPVKIHPSIRTDIGAGPLLDRSIAEPQAKDTSITVTLTKGVKTSIHLMVE